MWPSNVWRISTTTWLCETLLALTTLITEPTLTCFIFERWENHLQQNEDTLWRQHCVLRCCPSVAKRGNIVGRRADTRNISEDFQKHFCCPEQTSYPPQMFRAWQKRVKSASRVLLETHLAKWPTNFLMTSCRCSGSSSSRYWMCCSWAIFSWLLVWLPSTTRGTNGDYFMENAHVRLLIRSP